MDTVEGQGATTQSSSSSTGEPVAVRRRLDLDGSFTGSVAQRHGQQSPTPPAADAGNKDGDEVLDSAGVSSSSRDSKRVLAGDSNTSDADNRRRTAVSGNASGVAGDGEHQKVAMVSEMSESRSESEDTTEKETGVTSGKDDSDPDKESGTDLHNLPSPFGGSANSLAELDQAYKRGSEALKQEMEREDKVLSVNDEHVSRVSQLINRFQGIANVDLGEILTRIENRDLRGSDVYTGGFGKRLDVIKAYVSDVCTAAPSGERCESPEHSDFSMTDTANERERSTSDEDQERLNGRSYVRQRYAVRRASNSVRKSQNVVIRQRKVMSKLYAVAGQHVSKARVSCRLILDCLKTVVTVLTPAVGACLLLDTLVRALERDGQPLPALKIAASVASRWTSEALLHGERAVRLHKDASEALKSATWDLVVMGTYETDCAVAFADIMSAGDRFLELTRQPDVSLAQIWDQVSQIKSMKGRLTSDIKEMRKLGNIAEQWSAECGDKLSVILQTVTSVTQSSCNAIEEATKAVVDIIIPAGVSLEEKPILDFMELFK